VQDLLSDASSESERAGRIRGLQNDNWIWWAIGGRCCGIVGVVVESYGSFSFQLIPVDEAKQPHSISEEWQVPPRFGGGFSASYILIYGCQPVLDRALR
jgi:hypothetical protein